MVKPRLALVIIFLLSIPSLYAQQKTFSLYLIGDAGEQSLETNGLRELLQAHADPSVASAVVFLGDNIYPKGMPDEGEKGRAEAEAILRDQVQTVEFLKSQVYFIPGNHDWKKGKKDGLNRILNQAAWVDSLKKENIHFLPQGGCPGPVEVSLGGNVTLVILDSQWFLHPWDKPEGEESPCDIKRPGDGVIELQDILDRQQGKRVIVVAHHPIFTYGEHGGVFTWKDHIFPFREIDKSLYIPLPVVGSIYPLYRKIFGNIQDVAHPLNKQYTHLVAELLEKYPGTIYANGHEHALQYSWKDSVHYVTSGSGVKDSFVKKKGYARYVSPQHGFVRIDMLSNGGATINYYEVDKKEAAYQVAVEPSRPSSPDTETKLPDFSKPVRVHASDLYQAGAWRSRWLGQNYRAEWKQDIDVPVFDLGTEANGLKVLQKGGGMQTLSLRLADSAHHEYTLRSVEKFPAKAVPEILKKTFAQDLVQDQISAAHPYGALVIAPMAEKAGIYYTRPKLVYIPDDPRLGLYRKEFGNTLALFEERPDGDASDKPHFGNAKKVISTDKVLAKLAEDNDNYVDQEFVVRSRLFDMVIGDWDRHDDQWRWAVFKNKKAEFYRPIPRDRDQAFFVSEGSLAKLWGRRWALPKFEGFHDEVGWPPGLMFNGRYFDRSFLNQTTSQQWLKEAQGLQKNLTDASIDSAIHGFPDEIYKLHGEEIIRKLKSRRDRLPGYALQHYKFLAREVDIPGSNKQEYFDVDRQASGDVRVRVYKVNKDGEKSDKLYDRLFLRGETKEVRLFGLGGDDVFKLEGEGKGGMTVRVIGGDGKDSVLNNATRGGLRKSYKVYDLPAGISITDRHAVANRTSKDPAVNNYDRRAFRYPRFAPLVYGAFNYDDGLFIGGGFLHTTHGFRKEPYKSQHLFLASYAILTSSYNFKYDGRFSQVFGTWGLALDADLKAPNYVNNFFGWGNETVYNDELDDDPAYEDELERSVDYYRIRLQQIDLQVMLTHSIGSLGFFRIGPVFQRVEIEEPKSDLRYIREYAETLSEPLFEEAKTFTGLRVDWGIDKRDHPVLTTRGVVFSASSRALKGTDSKSRDFTAHNATLVFYQTFKLPAKVTFALRAGGGINTGKKYELYQAQILDGKTELRGFRKTRFYGDSKLYGNSEVRIKLASLRTYLFPASFGINGFFDIGRVWYKDAEGVDPSTTSGVSHVWHKGFGGGVWFTPFNLTVLSGELAHSKDGNMFYIRLGFLF